MRLEKSDIYSDISGYVLPRGEPWIGQFDRIIGRLVKPFFFLLKLCKRKLTEFHGVQVQAGIVDHLVRKNVPGYHLPQSATTAERVETTEGSQALSKFSQLFYSGNQLNVK